MTVYVANAFSLQMLPAGDWDVRVPRIVPPDGRQFTKTPCRSNIHPSTAAMSADE